MNWSSARRPDTDKVLSENTGGWEFQSINTPISVASPSVRNPKFSCQSKSRSRESTGRREECAWRALILTHKGEAFIICRDEMTDNVIFFFYQKDDRGDDLDSACLGLPHSS